MKISRLNRKWSRKNKLGLIFALVGIAVIVALGAARSLLPAAVAAPVVILPAQAHDFSPLLPLSKGSYTFTIKNPLAEILFIDRIAKSCGCTTAESDRSLVLPGQTFTVTAVLSTHGDAETMESHITLNGHAGRRRVEGHYQLMGTIENLIEFPDSGGGSLNLGSWDHNQLPTETSVIVKRGKYPLAFDQLIAQCQTPALAIHVQPIDRDTFRVCFHINSVDALGTCSVPVTFGFASNGVQLSPTVVKQTYLEVLGPILPSPSSLLITLSPGDHFQKTISVVRRSTDSGDGAPLQIMAVSTASKNMAIGWQKEGQPGVFTVDYVAPFSAATERGEIIISVLDRGATYKLKVGYLAMVS